MRFHNRRQRANIGETDRNAQALLLGQMKDSNRANRALNLNRALIASTLDDFNALDRARFEVSQHGIPVIRWLITQTERYTRCGRRRTGDLFLSQGAWWSMKQIPKYFVEPAYTAESRCQCNLGHRHSRFMNELFGYGEAGGIPGGAVLTVVLVQRRRASVGPQYLH